MKLQDFDFRIVPKPNEAGEYCNCPNKDCPAKKFHFIIGNEAKSRLSEEELQDCEIEFYTGFRDSNDNKIYEGDIIEITNHRFNESLQVEVIFENGGLFTRVIKSYDEDEVPLNEKLFLFNQIQEMKKVSDEWLLSFEVVGNIHENIDLLESREFESKKLNCENNRRCKCPTSEQKIYI